MTQDFSIVPLPQLLEIILNQYERSDFVLGIPKDLFFNPESHKKIQLMKFRKSIESPIGVAAGPQTQLAQNIIAAWLMGARFIELKTVQTLDEIEVSKPCIDMQDEGYNCEWSQELKIKQSFDQYLNAWIIIHVLRDKFGWNSNTSPGVIFNMSVGYDYQGILQDNIQWFFDNMADASDEMDAKIASIVDVYPAIKDLKICPTISDNITLSTMHGCPSEEIEKIGEYLLKEKNLHTTIKLNPTLFGREPLLDIINKSGFETVVPDIAFEHDLKYDQALSIIHNLQKIASDKKLEFGVKLTNTLESQNNKDVFPKDENMMYMSGRVLHPISISLANKLQNDFNGNLSISFSGGADSQNIADVVKCGLIPATVCTDLLKPGGYGRLHQYISSISSIDLSNQTDDANYNYLASYAEEVVDIEYYKRTYLKPQSIKTERPLNMFDCIQAPCVDTCPTNQGIPDYMYHTSNKDFDKAADIILKTNPFPRTTGMVCDHLCQTKCTRINYDNPLLIRDIKRVVAENISDNKSAKASILEGNNNKKVAVIGAGPSGLSCAYFLTLAGMNVEIFESKAKPGGMVSGAIPSFRLTDEAFNLDVEKIKEAGVKVHYNFSVDSDSFVELQKQNNFIYIATGAQISKPLNIEGINGNGVLDPLDFLFKVKSGEQIDIGNNVIIIGGGNTAMDTARTAYRCVGEKGKVTVVYRRTIKQMPADTGEIHAVIDEGINIIELAAPLSIASNDGQITSLLCRKMKLGPVDESGRARPVEIPGSEFEIAADTIIPAIGQDLDIDFVDHKLLVTNRGTYQTTLKNVFIGGDAMRGASTAINAIGDGRKAAEEIVAAMNQSNEAVFDNSRPDHDYKELKIKRVIRQFSDVNTDINLDNRKNFNLVSRSLTKEEAETEASRCLYCDEICDICTTVCPNLAFHSFKTDKIEYNTQRIDCKNGNYVISDSSAFEIHQTRQILHIADWCNQCGNCVTFCPSSGSPFIEKPHLYINEDEFCKCKDGFFYSSQDGNPMLKFYHNELLMTYNEINNVVILESEKFRIEIASETMSIINIEVREKANFEVDLFFIAGVSIIMQGVIEFFALRK